MTRRVVILALAVAFVVALGAAALLQADWAYSPDADKWTRTPAATDTEAEGSDNLFAKALDAYRAGDLDGAERMLQSWLRLFRSKRDAQAALFLSGEILRVQGNYDDAFTAYEELLDHYGGTDLFDRVLANETEMANSYLDGKKHKVLKMFWVSAEDEGQTMLEKIHQRDPRGVRGKKALLTLADYHFRIGHFGEASDEYQRVITSFPHDPDVPQLKLLAAQATLGRFHGTKTDPSALKEAEQQFKLLRDEHPELAGKEQVSHILQGIDERKAESDFNVAEFYKRTNKDKGAIYYYRAVVRDYPGTVWAQRTHDRLAAMGVDEQADSTAPPRVLAAGIGLPSIPAPARPPLPGSPGLAGTDALAFGGGRGPKSLAPIGPVVVDNEDTPPIVVWAGPAPVLRNFGDEGVIDIGWIDENSPALAADVVSVKQLAEVAGPTLPSPATQPEARDER